MQPNLYALELLEHFGEIISCFLENLHKWYTEVRVFFSGPPCTLPLVELTNSSQVIDRQTPDHYTDPAPHIMRAVLIIHHLVKNSFAIYIGKFYYF